MGMPLLFEGPPYRELTLVPKKGRPITQCQHCRQERKKRSAHVSCDCGEVEKPHHPKEKCIHLREAEDKAKTGTPDEHPVHSTERETAHLAAVAEEQGCCCHHGGKCTCALRRKEMKDEDKVRTFPHGPAVKPRLETTRSEGSITKFENGHHKPVHRRNHLAHESGMPYKMPMPRSRTDEHVKTTKPSRSMDSLALHGGRTTKPSAFTPQTSAPFNTERRMSRSEQPSPKFGAADSPAGFQNPGLSPMDFGNLDASQLGQADASTAGRGYPFVPIEPLSGVSDRFNDPWQKWPPGDHATMPANNYFGVWPSSIDNIGLGQPALTAASSGTHSEIDEIPAMDDTYSFGMPSIQEDTGNAYFSDFAAPGSPQINRHSLPPDFSMLASANSDWPLADYNGYMGNDSTAIRDGKDHEAPQGLGFPDPNTVWPLPSFPTITDLPHRQGNGAPTSGRPASHPFLSSPQPINTNGEDDPFADLFPGLNCQASSNYYNSNTNSPSQPNFAAADFSKSVPSTNSTSAPIGFRSAPQHCSGHSSDAHNPLTPAPWWVDGSMSMPGAAFGPPFAGAGSGREYAEQTGPTGRAWGWAP
ncbi:hypothetical protein B0A50_04292 [Salinomyces thailandicus]|uniref:Copper-fist domain-containing protein n=1 Tax=Salinomyces thailandicus TaxID=706561 RepID=A0A4U0TXV9_9PEZI|nr:hypothetical protein B0A50_04292 [Salinomyces thailandica]